MSASAELSLTVSYFPTAFPSGPAFGAESTTTWETFAHRIRCHRREGDKDGPGFVPARFQPEPDGQVRRIKRSLLARTAIVLDIETNKQTAEKPPPVGAAVAKIKDHSWAALVYTSHSHSPEAPRYRIVLPLSEEIAPDLPAVEVVAGLLGFAGTLDRTKIGAASLFYLPSSRPGGVEHHEVVEVVGAPISAAWLQERAGAVMAEREAERERQRAEAFEAATTRREERARRGVDPDSSIIEAVRHRLDLEGELISYGYLRVADGRYLFPGSESGVAGVYVLTGCDGVERVFSHHSADPLAASNLPSW